MSLPTETVLLVLLVVPEILSARGLPRDQELSGLELQERHLMLAHRRAGADTLRDALEATRDLFARGFVTQLTLQSHPQQLRGRTP